MVSPWNAEEGPDFLGRLTILVTLVDAETWQRVLDCYTVSSVQVVRFGVLDCGWAMSYYRKFDQGSLRDRAVHFEIDRAPITSPHNVSSA